MGTKQDGRTKKTMRTKKMINPRAAKIRSEMWMMEPRARAALLGRIFSVSEESFAKLAAVEINRERPAMRVESGVAIVNIHGVLMKDPPAWLTWFGIETTDYGQIIQQLAEAVGSSAVSSILLHVNSPGGTVAGTSEAAAAIKAAAEVKPVSAVIEDLGASAAYLLASQAKKITANINAEIGSIGTYTVYEDSSKMFELAGVREVIIRSGEHKGMGEIGVPITEAQVAAIQEIVNGMAANFKLAVAAGRGMALEAVEKLADGRVWLAGQAKELGLIDEVINENINGSKTANNSKGKDMAEEKGTSTAAGTAGETQNSAATIAELKAAFPDEPAFVLEQAEARASMVEAKAAYADVLKARNAELKRQNAELQKNGGRKSGGAAAVPAGGEGAAPGEGDFMQAVKDYAEEHKCSQTDALKAVRKKDPAMFNRFRRECSNRKVDVKKYDRDEE